VKGEKLLVTKEDNFKICPYITLFLTIDKSVRVHLRCYQCNLCLWNFAREIIVLTFE